MAIKHKCRNCACATLFAIPEDVSEINYEYAHAVLNALKDWLYCSEKMQVKRIDQKGCCTDFSAENRYSTPVTFLTRRQKAIADLEKMIADYEASLITKGETEGG